MPAGKASLDTVAVTLAPAGKAVFLSALTVVLSLAAIFVVPVMVFRPMALGKPVRHRLVDPASRHPRPARRPGAETRRGGDPDTAAEGRLARWTTVAMRRPGATLAAGLGILLLLAAPAIGMRLGMPGAPSSTGAS